MHSSNTLEPTFLQDDNKFQTCVALLLTATLAVPLLKGFAPGFYSKRRSAVLLLIRLVMAGCAAVSAARCPGPRVPGAAASTKLRNSVIIRT